MVEKLISALLVILSAVSAETKAKSAHRKTASENCVLTVTSIRNTGDMSERVFSIRTRSKAECQKNAKIHETNFAPQSVKRKAVRYQWYGGSGDQSR